MMTAHATIGWLSVLQCTIKNAGTTFQMRKLEYSFPQSAALWPDNAVLYTCDCIYHLYKSMHPAGQISQQLINN